MLDYLKVVQWWKPDLKDDVDRVLRSFPCTLPRGDRPKSHPIVGTKPPTTRKQSHLSTDVLNISGVPFLHRVDRGTKWSETAHLRNHALSGQVRAFKMSRLYRHGVPRAITAYREYAKGYFKNMCLEL